MLFFILFFCAEFNFLIIFPLTTQYVSLSVHKQHLLPTISVSFVYPGLHDMSSHLERSVYYVKNLFYINHTSSHVRQRALLHFQELEASFFMIIIYTQPTTSLYSINVQFHTLLAYIYGMDSMRFNV